MSTKSEANNKIPKGVAAARDAYDWIQCVLAALVICILAFVFVFRIIDVDGGSMNPTLIDGDKTFVSGLFYTPKAGDMVAFKSDEYDSNKALIKRVIATEGQVINIDFDKGIVYIDGEEIEEPYIKELTRNKLDFIGPKTVPENCVFVMGDNRNASIDSRDSRIGMLDTRLIIGKVYMIVYPFSDFGFIS